SMGLADRSVPLAGCHAGLLRRVANELQEVGLSVVSARRHGTSLVGASEDQFDHESGFIGPRVPNRLLVDRGISRLHQKQADRHRLVVAEDDLVSGHGQDCNKSLRRYCARGSADCRVSGGSAQPPASDFSRLVAVSLGLILYQACSILPFSSIRNAERRMPMYLRPYIDFSCHTS